MGAGTAPRIPAGLRDLAVGLARLIGWAHIAATQPTAFDHSVSPRENASALGSANGLSDRRG